MSFVKKNEFSQKKEFKLFNSTFENYVYGKFISKKLKNNYQSLIYKQTTQEVKQVEQICHSIIQTNNLGKFLPNLKICLVHNQDSISLYMSAD